MTDVVKKLLKVNLRARSKARAQQLLLEVLGGEAGHDRSTDTIDDFEASLYTVGGVLFDVVVPTSPTSSLAKVIDKHGEGVDSLCYGVADIELVRERFRSKDIEFARMSEFHGNKVGFVHPRDACGMGLEFIEGPLAELDD